MHAQILQQCIWSTFCKSDNADFFMFSFHTGWTSCEVGIPLDFRIRRILLPVRDLC